MTIIFTNTLESQSDTLIVPLAATHLNDGALKSIEVSAGIALPLLFQDFKAEAGEVCQLYSPKGRLFLIGLGATPSLPETLRAFRSFAHKYRNKISNNLFVSFLHHNKPDNLRQTIEAVVNGLLLATYHTGAYKSENGEPHTLLNPLAQLFLGVEDTDTTPLEQAAARGRHIAQTQLGVFELVNAPGNKKSAELLGQWALKSGANYGYRVEVLDFYGIQEQGLHALLAVNQGSVDPPSFIIMEYKPEAPGDYPLVGLVGKGVTFDTGGLSIKPSANMHYMKSDMGGAGAVLGAIEAAARLQLPVHIVAVIPATENSVDAKSLKPGDVIGSYSGKTIEVIDTDAEGRLILADGLSFIIRNYQPQVVIDLATLTGSAVRTLGYHAGALFSNNDALAEALSRAADLTGERLWRLPIWDAYKDDIRSDIADVRNFSGKPTAGAIAAAKFLEAFIDNHPAWAHLDIAGVAYNDSEFASQKTATAYGVRLLLAYMEQLVL